MNFPNIPGLDWPYGYAFAFGLMVLVGSFSASCSDGAVGSDTPNRARARTSRHLK